MITASFFKTDNWLSTACRYYYAVTYTILIFLEIVAIGFYKNFGCNLNIVLFDFFDENPGSLIKTIWEEYPVIWLTLLLSAGFVIFLKMRIIGSAIKDKRNYLLLICLIVFFVIAMRGSVTRFPLQVEDLRVSENQKINDLIPNPAYLLKKIIKEKRQTFDLINDSQILAKYGFKSEEEAITEAGIENGEFYTTMKKQLPDSIKPNIVVIFCESWSGFMVHKYYEENDGDMLCGMQRHFKEDILLSNYQSVENGTIASIENFVISTPFSRVFRSKYRFLKFPTL